MTPGDADSMWFEQLRRVARSDQLQATVDAMLTSREGLLSQLRAWSVVIDADTSAEVDVIVDQIQGALLRMIADGSLDATVDLDQHEGIRTVAKQLDVVTGLVERISEKGTGVKVNGEWCTASQYANPPIGIPKLGQRVNLTAERTDRGIWIQSVEVLDGGQIHQLPQPQRRGGGRSPAELRDIRRLSVLKAAAAFAASRPDLKSADVLAIASRWLTWVEEKGGEQPN